MRRAILVLALVIGFGGCAHGAPPAVTVTTDQVAAGLAAGAAVLDPLFVDARGDACIGGRVAAAALRAASEGVAASGATLPAFALDLTTCGAPSNPAECATIARAAGQVGVAVVALSGAPCRDAAIARASIEWAADVAGDACASGGLVLDVAARELQPECS